MAKPTTSALSALLEGRPLRGSLAIGLALGGCLLVARPSRGQASPPPPSFTPSSPIAGPGLPPPIPGNLEMSAELLEVDQKTQTAVLSGKVVLAKGELSLHCPRLEARFDAAGARVSWARGSGGVVAEVKGVHAEATEFDYDIDKQLLALRGGVRLFRAGGWLSADGADLDLAAGKVSMTSVKASVPVGGAIKK